MASLNASKGTDMHALTKSAILQHISKEALGSMRSGKCSQLVLQAVAASGHRRGCRLPCIEEETDVDTTDDFTSSDETSEGESVCTSRVGGYGLPDPVQLSRCKWQAPQQHPNVPLTAATLARHMGLPRDPTTTTMSASLQEVMTLFEEVGGGPKEVRRYPHPGPVPNVPSTPAVCANDMSFPPGKGMTASLRELLTLCDEMKGEQSKALDFGGLLPVPPGLAPPQPLPSPPGTRAALKTPPRGAASASAAHVPGEVMTLLELSDYMWEV